jgi:hypothetical protein
MESSCVINNGTTSPYFKLGRGVRQGDPLSPYLFLLVAEVLACSIRQNNDIKGIQFGNKEIKILQFADDANGTLSDQKSAKAFLKTVAIFGEFSGLKLNKMKTEAVWLGSFRNRTDKPLGIEWPNQPLRFLGVFISYNDDICRKLNFDDRLEKCKKILESWKSRILTLIGRAQIIKTFVVSQYLYTLSAINMPEECIVKLEKLISNFIWLGGRPKINNSMLKQPLNKGGLRIPDVRSMIKTNRIKWVKKLIYSEYHIWKSTFTTFLADCGLRLNNLLFGNYNLKSLKPYHIQNKVPQFYLEILNSWSEVGQPLTKQFYIWYNKDIQIENKSVFYEPFAEKGIKQINDLYQDNGKIKNFEDLELDHKEWFNWYRIIQRIKQTRGMELNKEKIEDCEIHKIGEVKLETVQTNYIYRLFLDKLKFTNDKIRTQKYVEIAEEENIQIIFRRCHKYITDTVTRTFQYKFLNDILANNFWLEKWKIIENNKCTFCNNREENIYHLFVECDTVKIFWLEFNTWLNLFNPIQINEKFIFYGTDDVLIYCLIISAKRYLYDCRNKKVAPTMQNYQNIIKYIKKIEFECVRKNGQIDNFCKKWDPLNNFL